MSKIDTSHFVFVYGSLKEGFGNFWHLKDCEKYDEGITLEKTFKMVPMYGNGFPAVYRLAGDWAILGEIYVVNQDCLDSLDLLEGHPHLYRRVMTDIVCSDGELIQAWMYAMGPDKFGRHIANPTNERIELVEIDGVTVANWLPAWSQDEDRFRAAGNRFEKSKGRGR